MANLRKPIGIVGGMGPYAGLQLVERIFDNTLAGSDQEHLEVILVSSPDIPDRTEFLLGNVKDNPAYRIVEILERMSRLGVVVAGIPCNTAHAGPILGVVKAELQKKELSIRIVDMIDETMKILQTAAHSRVGVLATTGAIKANVYSGAFGKAGMECVVPDANVQERLHRAIYDKRQGIKAKSNPPTPWAVERVQEAVDHLIAKGSTTIVLACTELPLVVREGERNGTPLVDPATILARALIKSVAPERLKPV